MPIKRRGRFYPFFDLRHQTVPSFSRHSPANGGICGTSRQIFLQGRGTKGGDALFAKNLFGLIIKDNQTKNLMI